ncbi:hemagglutinin-like protein [Thermoplasmatales archaeon SCGC AB-540-F20]|nr:hemagglutinin-like protein [Thermoplasmatales archaeon SCGC AB-540-F20]
MDDDRASGEISRSGGAATIGSSGNTAIGRYAIAMGHNTTANGWSSTAMGEGTTASGTASTAMGNNSIASSYFSIAMGWNAIANAYAATAIGPYTIASGNYSRAIGYGTTASGHEATAIGVNTTASGQYATTMGFGTTASGLWSTALGRYIIVEGDNSVGIGLDGSSRTVTPDNVMSIMGGNVGIGTTSPSYLLDVSGGDDIVAQFSGRVKGADAVNDDEFATKKQVDSVSISRFTPTGTSDSNGNVGDTAWDDNYYYVKTPDGWKRAALETWESPSLFTK